MGNNLKVKPMVKILILSDERDVSALFQLVLEREGYKCVTTNSVQDFLSQLQSSKFDIFVLILPLDSQPNGWVLYKDLKADTAFDNIPVIVYTALYRASFPNPKDYGDELFTKPMNTRDLQEAAKRFLNRGTPLKA
jgi:DNA-binding response OmpR family regulator